MTNATRLALLLSALVAGCPGPEAITDGATNTRYPMPPTSRTSESAAIAPTFPSTEAITASAPCPA